MKPKYFFAFLTYLFILPACDTVNTFSISTINNTGNSSNFSISSSSSESSTTSYSSSSISNSYPSTTQSSSSSSSSSTSISETESIKEYFNKLVKPDITYAEVNLDLSGIRTTILAEIVEDSENGKTYHIKNELIDDWVAGENVTIVTNKESIPVKKMSDADIEMYINTENKESDTSYFVWVDLRRQVINVMKRDFEIWKLVRSIDCATGKVKTPSKRGEFKIDIKGFEFVNKEKTYVCYNWVRYSGDYLFHSIPFNNDGTPMSTVLRQKISSGCIRMSLDDSLWFYNTIPVRTTVWVN